MLWSPHRGDYIVCSPREWRNQAIATLRRFFASQQSLFSERKRGYRKIGRQAEGCHVNCCGPRPSEPPTSRRMASESSFRGTKKGKRAGRLEMDKVRCPYCVTGNGFRRMVRHGNFSFVCDKCGHS